MGGVGGWRIATGVSGAVFAAPARAAAFSAQHPPRGHAARTAADGAGAVRRIRRPDQFAAECDFRFIPAYGQRVVAVLRRPFDGVSGGPVGRGARHHIVAEPVQALREPVRRGIFGIARLGAALNDHADRACGCGARLAGHAPGHHAVHAWRIFRDRCTGHTCRADRLQHRPAGVDPGQSAGAGVLRTAGYPHAGENRGGHAGDHAVDELRVYRAVQACGVGAGDGPGFVPERGLALLPVAQTRDPRTATGMGDFFA